nr:MAG TPA: hypothetical protein [Caudoviricetes sp.]
MGSPPFTKIRGQRSCPPLWGPTAYRISAAPRSEYHEFPQKARLAFLDTLNKGHRMILCIISVAFLLDL